MYTNFINRNFICTNERFNEATDEYLLMDDYNC